MTLALAIGVALEACAADGPLEQGAAAFRRGALEEAATRWTSAAKSYAEQGQVANRISALTNLAHAQAELGQYSRAAASLGTALELAQASGDRRRAAAIDAALGNVYIALGPPETAERHLRNALLISRSIPDPALTAQALNDLGNLLNAQHQYAEALAAYRESIGLADNPSLSLLSARSRINAATALREEGQPREALAMLDAALAGLRKLAPSHEVAFTLVSAALGYRDLRSSMSAERDRLLLEAGSVLTYAARSAEQIGDRRSASYAWGYLGGLYEERSETPRRSTSPAKRSSPLSRSMLRSRSIAGNGKRAGCCTGSARSIRRSIHTAALCRRCKAFAPSCPWATHRLRPPFEIRSGRCTSSWSTSCWAALGHWDAARRSRRISSKHGRPSSCSKWPSCATIFGTTA
jgi:tetratricopeptide (TPR) repeat protein